MITIGLTGGIGAGKSTVSKYLKSRGYYVIDTDQMARDMTAPGSVAMPQIKQAFGEEYILPDGRLDRKALGDLVFKDGQKLEVLQSIITSRVIQASQEILDKLRREGRERIVFLDAPLLFECGVDTITDENWLVKASPEDQIKRVMDRDGLTRDQVVARISNQMPQAEKEKRSHCILDNSGTLEALKSQIDKELERIENEI